MQPWLTFSYPSELTATELNARRATVGDADGVIHRKQVTVGSVDGDADGARTIPASVPWTARCRADRRRVLAYPSRPGTRRLSPVESVVRRRQRRRRSSSTPSTLTVTCAPRCWQYLRRQDPLRSSLPGRPRKARSCCAPPESVGNPLHNVVVEPFELAGHRGADLTSIARSARCLLRRAR